MIKIIKIFIIILLLTFTTNLSMGFEDTVQRYPTDQITDLWSVSGVAPSIQNYPVLYPTANVINRHNVGGITTISPYDTVSSDYIAFTIHYMWEEFHYIKYYDEDTLVLIDSYKFNAHGQTGLFEFIKSGNSIILYRDGVSQGAVMTVAADTVYIEIVIGHAVHGCALKIDDFTDNGNILGMSEEWSEAVTYIDTSYSIRSMFSFPTAVYDIRMRKISTGATINTTVLPSNQSAGDKPCGFMRYNRNDILGTNYGLYQLTLNRDDTKLGETTFWYQYSINFGSVMWSKDTYSIGETASIPYSLESPDFGVYNYKIKTMGINGVVDDSWTISDLSGTKTADLSNYDTGIKYVIFSRTDKGSGDVIEFSYDFATLSESVVINGNTTNAIAGDTISEVNINFSQGNEWYNTTSDSMGAYNLTELSTDIEVICNANVTSTNYTQIINETFNSSDYNTWITLNYTMLSNGSILVSNTTDETPFTILTDYNMNYTDGKIMILSTGSMINWTDYHINYNITESFSIIPFTFTPLIAKLYTINLYLFNINHTYENTSIYGLISTSPYHQAVNNSTVTIWNSTWNSSTQATTTGYYVFHNLNNTTTYTLNASATSHTTSSDYNVIASGNATRQDILLNQLYTITIKAKESGTTAYLSEFIAWLGEDQSNTTSGSIVLTNIPYGIHSISVVADGYYPEGTTELIDADITITLYLTIRPTESEYYAPHYVKFKLLNIFGKKYPNVPTIVYQENIECLNGTTGTDGAVTFKLTENIQYKLTFINLTQNIDETVILYPKDTEYYIYINEFSFKPDETGFKDNIEWKWISNDINITHSWINFTYEDHTNKTTFIEYWVNTSNDTNLFYFNATNISIWSINQTVNAENVSYMVHYSAVHPDYPSLENSAKYTINFFGMQISFGWSETWHYSTVATCIIIFIALLFSGTNAHLGALICVLTAWWFVWISWLPSNASTYIMLVLATVVAVAVNIRKGENQ